MDKYTWEHVNKQAFRLTQVIEQNNRAWLRKEEWEEKIKNNFETKHWYQDHKGNAVKKEDRKGNREFKEKPDQELIDYLIARKKQSDRDKEMYRKALEASRDRHKRLEEVDSLVKNILVNYSATVEENNAQDAMVLVEEITGDISKALVDYGQFLDKGVSYRIQNSVNEIKFLALQESVPIKILGEKFSKLMKESEQLFRILYSLSNNLLRVMEVQCKLKKKHNAGKERKSKMILKDVY